VRYEVLTAVRIMLLFFWVVTPCRLVGRYQRLGETYCFHFQSSTFSPEDGDTTATYLHGVTIQNNNIIKKIFIKIARSLGHGNLEERGVVTITK
jgi:hypothetical protein